MISGDKKGVGLFIALCGFAITMLGLSISITQFNIVYFEINSWISIYLSVLLLGLLDGTLEPLILNKIVTQSNRPEFFTGLFYFQGSLSALMVVSLPR